MARSKIQEAINATRKEDYLRGLTLFVDVYGSEDAPPLLDGVTATGLSFFGLCIALVQKKYKPAIDLCTRAVKLQFYNGEHYSNLARVYMAAGNRKKAVEIADQGLKVAPEHKELMAVREELGVRARPTVPFLDRAHPINVTMGMKRHAKKPPAKKKPRDDDES